MFSIQNTSRIVLIVAAIIRGCYFISYLSSTNNKIYQSNSFVSFKVKCHHCTSYKVTGYTQTERLHQKTKKFPRSQQWISILTNFIEPLEGNGVLSFPRVTSISQVLILMTPGLGWAEDGSWYHGMVFTPESGYLLNYAINGAIVKFSLVVNNKFNIA